MLRDKFLYLGFCNLYILSTEGLNQRQKNSTQDNNVFLKSAWK